MWTFSQNLPSRRELGAAATDSFFRGASRIGRLHPDARPERHGLEVVKDLPYRDDGLPAHLLDVYRPSGGATGRPVVLYIHGGGFRILSKDTHWLMALAFARRGYVVFTINYRLAGEARYPAAIEDCCAAYRWVVANARQHGGDPDRIVLAGESAGANLAVGLSLALSWKRPEPFAAETWAVGAPPAAVLAACGVFQVSDIARLRRRKPKMPAFVVDRLEEVEEAYLGKAPPVGDPRLDLADPVNFLEREAIEPTDRRALPPYFLPVGTRDPLLPDTRRMEAALRALGATAEARYYPGGVHAFHAFVFYEGARRCWQDSYGFLERFVPVGRQEQTART